MVCLHFATAQALAEALACDRFRELEVQERLGPIRPGRGLGRARPILGPAVSGCRRPSPGR